MDLENEECEETKVVNELLIRNCIWSSFRLLKITILENDCPFCSFPHLPSEYIFINLTQKYSVIQNITRPVLNRFEDWGTGQLDHLTSIKEIKGKTKFEIIKIYARRKIQNIKQMWLINCLSHSALLRSSLGWRWVW